MRGDLQETLFARYPEVFRRDSESRPTLRHGVECGDGWFHLIDALCSILVMQTRHKARLAQTEPDSEAREALRAAAEVAAEAVPAAIQIKEKLGGLQLFLRGVPGEHKAAILMVEMLSRSVCEACGGQGELRTGSWLVTQCDACWYSTLRRRAERAGEAPPATWPCGCVLNGGELVGMCDRHEACLPPSLLALYSGADRVAAGRAICELLGFVEPRHVSDAKLQVGDLAKAHELRQSVYKRHGAGCCLHVVLDDANFSTAAVRECLNAAAIAGCRECVELGKLMLRMSKTQREKLSANGYAPLVAEICGRASADKRRQS